MTPIYLANFFDPGNEWLNLFQLPWQSRTEARQEIFMADWMIEYTYGAGRNRRSYTTIDLDPFVREVMGRVNEYLGELGPMNGCFLNRYDDEHQALGWHADDFEGMDHSKAVAVVSYGTPREIWWRPRGEKGVVPTDQRRLLEHGSLFVMPPGFQQSYFHRIPKGDHPMKTRISLTFRNFKETS